MTAIKLKNFNPSQTGSLTLELILSLAFFGIVISGILTLIFSNQYLIIDSGNSQQAIAMSSGGIAGAKGEGFAYEPAADLQSEVFTKKETQEWLADYAKNVLVNTSFKIAEASKEVGFDQVFFDSQNTLGRDTCNLYFSNSWQNPELVSSASLSANNPATDVDVNNNLVYVSSNSATQSLEDLSVFDVSNLNSPELKNKINTGPGLAAIHKAGKYIFAANDGVSDQLEIINVENPNSLGPTIKIKVPNFNGQPSDGKGNSIFYYQNKIFLGLTKNNGPELHVYDVSNPQFPYWLGAYETNTAVTGIYVFNNIAYLALADGKLLDVLDISNPSNISELTHYSPSGSTSQSAQSVGGLGDKVFLGRAGGLPALGYKELIMLNKNTPPAIMAEYDLNASVRGMFVRSGLIFLSTNESNKELQIFNFSPPGSSFLSGLDLPAPATGIDCEGDNLFLSLENGAMAIIAGQN